MSSDLKNLTENPVHTKVCFDDLDELISSVAAEEKELKVCINIHYIYIFFV